jgi:hypothetical protein
VNNTNSKPVNARRRFDRKKVSSGKNVKHSSDNKPVNGLMAVSSEKSKIHKKPSNQ